MMIIYICKVFAVCGGLERVWTDKMNALAEIPGYEVCLVTTDQLNQTIPYPLNENVRHIDLDIRFFQQYQYKGLKRFWIYRKLLKLFQSRLKIFLEAEKPDALITIASEFADFIIECKGNIPLVVESHGTLNRPFHMHL